MLNFTSGLKQTVAAGLLMFALALGGCIDFVSPVERETRTMKVAQDSGAPASKLLVRTDNGRVSVSSDAAAKDVSITAEVRAQTLERLSQTSVAATRDADGTLRVGVEWPSGGRKNNEGCDFDITVPAVSGVDITTSNGAINIRNLAGTAVLRTSNGAIVADAQGGDLDAKTSNGAIRVNDPLGAVRVKSNNGRIEVANAPSLVEAETSNGAVNVGLTSASPGPVSAETSNGSITLSLGPAFVGRLTLHTSNSGISVEGATGNPSVHLISMSKSDAELGFGDSHQDSTARTSNGSITVRVAGR